MTTNIAHIFPGLATLPEKWKITLVEKREGDGVYDRSKSCNAIGDTLRNGMPEKNVMFCCSCLGHDAIGIRR